MSLLEQSTMARTRHVYSPEEDEKILESYAEAKRLGLDVNVVLMQLAEEFGVASSNAIRARLAKLRKKQKRGQELSIVKSRQRRDLEATDSNVVSLLPETPETVKSSDSPLVQRIKELIAERNDYKAKYEALLAEYTEIKKLLGL